MTDLQVSVAAWCARNFPNTTVETQSLNVAEETGELCRAVLKRMQGIRGTDEKWSLEVRKEAADIVISLCNLAELEGFDLGDAVAERWASVSRRDWIADPVRGIA